MPSYLRSQSVPLSATIFTDITHWSATNPQLLDALYQSPYAVQSVFRSLPPLARLYVTRLLYLPENESTPTLEAFRKSLRRRQRALDRHDAAIRALRELRVFTTSPSGLNASLHDPSKIVLHPTFARELRRSVSNSIPSVFGGGSGSSDPKDLDSFAADRLESILNFLVESTNHNSIPSGIIDALVHIGVLEQRREGLTITSAGFHFLLKDTSAQLWILLRSVLSSMFPADVEALTLVFQLGVSTAGRFYDISNLSATQQELIRELHHLGIVILNKNTFQVTVVGVRLLANATRSSAGPSDGMTLTKSAGEIQVFVETNFRVYAYTTSVFQINLLALFTHMRYRLPSMVVGHLTRDAVRKALMNGITADQIIGYLNAHAHPRMKKGTIPANVSDEIRLWEAEQDRVQTKPGVLLSDFSHGFESVLSYARDLNAVLWSAPEREMLVVSKNTFDQVKRFIRDSGIQ
ncbi:RNA polymerase II transcription factor B subunit 2 [Gracilariopsis chorda]|uniref:General transcription factor IIH subunit 4 n=1 Tax=Gracilariopsis chorda TaxID=448386 RepID=A0A2V3IRG1_9FLOR|nr:RNA polymerase II transcription factor B subunit 2 [Gracilariopsis chorda]|eukprot:PXF44711.1 RNA polymerase II transcription factor B subunit 2 [Gracilariopsis chorda]